MRSALFATVLSALLVFACSSSKTMERGSSGSGGGTGTYSHPSPIPSATPKTYPNGGADGYDDGKIRTMAGSFDSATDQLQKHVAQIQPALAPDVVEKFDKLHKTSTDLLEHADEGATEGDQVNPFFQDVVKAYYDAKQASSQIQDANVRQDFDRVTELMRQMSQYFNYQFDPNRTEAPGTK